jgi:hypothetical protein
MHVHVNHIGNPTPLGVLGKGGHIAEATPAATNGVAGVAGAVVRGADDDVVATPCSWCGLRSVCHLRHACQMSALLLAAVRLPTLTRMWLVHTQYRTAAA